jgi:hypothetical protein
VTPGQSEDQPDEQTCGEHGDARREGVGNELAELARGEETHGDAGGEDGRARRAPD